MAEAAEERGVCVVVGCSPATPPGVCDGCSGDGERETGPLSAPRVVPCGDCGGTGLAPLGRAAEAMGTFVPPPAGSVVVLAPEAIEEMNLIADEERRRVWDSERLVRTGRFSFRFDDCEGRGPELSMFDGRSSLLPCSSCGRNMAVTRFLLCQACSPRGRSFRAIPLGDARKRRRRCRKTRELLRARHARQHRLRLEREGRR